MAIGVAMGIVAMPKMTSAASEPIVETRWGKVRGARQGSAYSFKGVRYGAPTGGESRFMPPQPPEQWAGVHEATEFGPIAPQSNPNPPPSSGPPPIITAQIERAPRANPAPRPSESEDCLFLNVWTPSLDSNRKLPVMVWLHGGFFRVGSGSSVDGTALAGRGDVVVVSLNHRLNIFGYNHLGDIAGPEFRHSGDAGMLDIMAALQWVQDNIHAFGGDSKRVMVFGASGGGMKTAFLMASPPASGLLHRAGVQSGPGLRMMGRDAATRASEMALRELGITPADAADIQMVQTDRLLSAFHAVSAELPASEYKDLSCFAPVLDAELLPHHPFDPVAAPRTAVIPMLIGWNREDMVFFMGADPRVFDLTEAELAARAETVLGHNAEAALALYRDLHPGFTPSQTYIRLVTEREMMVPTITQAIRHASAGDAGTYLYRLDWASPALDGKLGAPHSMEANFVFDTLESDPELTGTGPAAEALADKMSEAWVNFAANGAPDGTAEGLPAWPRFDPETRAAMILDRDCRVERGVTHEKYEFLTAANRSGE